MVNAHLTRYHTLPSDTVMSAVSDCFLWLCNYWIPCNSPFPNCMCQSRRV